MKLDILSQRKKDLPAAGIKHSKEKVKDLEKVCLEKM
jgi:hypothetical protein